jgi:hypothetical protein
MENGATSCDVTKRAGAAERGRDGQSEPDAYFCYTSAPASGKVPGMSVDLAKPHHIKGHDFLGNPVEELKTTPSQLSLFQTTFAPSSSSSIELYDAMPKYFASPKEMERQRRENGGQFLETLKRNFVHRGVGYELFIRPARIATKDGEEREYYPTKREHLIEQALRKLATNPLNGIYLGGNLAVQFSLSELRRELERTGHGLSYGSLMEGLHVNSATQLTLRTGDGKNVIAAAIFPTLMHASREQWQRDPKDTKCYVKFHPLVTLSVEELSYRELNYETMMKLDRLLSYYLFHRMSHLYVQAAYDKPYTILLSTLVRDAGMVNSPNPSDNVKRVRRSLQELQDKRVIMYWSEEVTRGENNRILEVKFSLFPSPQFKDDVIKANLHHRQLLAAASR